MSTPARRSARLQRNTPAAAADAGDTDGEQDGKHQQQDDSDHTGVNAELLHHVLFAVLLVGPLGLAIWRWTDVVAAVQSSESAAVPSVLQGVVPRISVLDFFGSVVVCEAYRRQAAFPKHALEALVACTLLQFGGTTLAHVFLLGQQPSWAASRTAWPALALAYMLTFYCPKDLWHTQIMSHAPLAYVVGVGSWVATAHAITSWGMEKALHADHPPAAGSLLCAILAGTISGCGGSILGDCLGVYHKQWGLKKVPEALKSPVPYGPQRAFICALVYYYMLNPHGYLHEQLPYVGAWAKDAAAARALLCVGIYLTQTVMFWQPQVDQLAYLHKTLEIIGISSQLDPEVHTGFTHNAHAKAASSARKKLR